MATGEPLRRIAYSRHSHSEAVANLQEVVHASADPSRASIVRARYRWIGSLPFSSACLSSAAVQPPPPLQCRTSARPR